LVALGLAAWKMSTSRLSASHRTVAGVLAVGVGLLFLRLSTVELVRTLNASAAPWISPQSLNFAVSALWALIAAIFVAIGMQCNYTAGRLLGIVLLGVTILKVFTYDLAFLEDLWRILSLVILGLILAGTSYLYYLYGERIKSWATGTDASSPGEQRPG
jgi:uncharacterized membrane protein